MPGQAAALNRKVRARAKIWLGWDADSQAATAHRGIRRWISDAVMHNTLDMALRYRPIVDYLKPILNAKASVVEAGSGSAGITPYLRRRVVGVDQNFDGPRSDWLERCFGSVVALPFADRSVDYVLCVDTLEHVPPKLRPKAVTELLRVTRRAAIIAVPCGSPSAQRDRDLSAVLQRRLGRHDRFVDEHLEYGLPNLDELESWIQEAGSSLERRFRTRHKDNVSLRIWWLVQMAKVSLLWRGFLIVSFPLVFTIFRRFNRPPGYRQIFFIESEASGSA